MKGARKMPESETRKAWTKANTVKICAKLQRSTDGDIVQYLDGKSAQAEIKKALRLLIETERKEQEQG